MSVPAKPRFAAGTTVSVEKSQAEIRELLRKYGVPVDDHYFAGVREGNIFVTFRVDAIYYRLELPLAKAEDARFAKFAGRAAKPNERQQMADQHAREQWRALLLVTKGLVVSIDAGLPLKQAFVGQMLLPSNQTVQQAMPQAIQTIYDTGKPPESLLALPPAKKQE